MGAPTSHVSPRRWLYTPVAASSTRASLSSFTASVDPSEVTASPACCTPAATNAAMLSASTGGILHLRILSSVWGTWPAAIATDVWQTQSRDLLK